ncbi:hypothetical protein L1887_61770 [Cichorium endivia]|nr:hypothetical protein L1887_61770 [Cichorium endivia]
MLSGVLLPGGKSISRCAGAGVVADDDELPAASSLDGCACCCCLAALVYEGGGLGPPPLTQSGSGDALDEVVPLDLMAGFFFLGAMGVALNRLLARARAVRAAVRSKEAKRQAGEGFVRPTSSEKEVRTRISDLGDHQRHGVSFECEIVVKLTFRARPKMVLPNVLPNAILGPVRPRAALRLLVHRSALRDIVCAPAAAPARPLPPRSSSADTNSEGKRGWSFTPGSRPRQEAKCRHHQPSCSPQVASFDADSCATWRTFHGLLHRAADKAAQRVQPKASESATNAAGHRRDA